MMSSARTMSDGRASIFWREPSGPLRWIVRPRSVPRGFSGRLGERQTGDNGLLTRAHFIRVSDQKHLWAGKIDIPAADIEKYLNGASKS